MWGDVRCTLCTSQSISRGLTPAHRATRFPGTLLVQPDPQNGLTMPSVALVFQMSALDRQNCLDPLGELDGGTTWFEREDQSVVDGVTHYPRDDETRVEPS